MAISVTITLSSTGTDTGPNFTLFCPTGTVTPFTASKSELLLGKTVVISDDNASQIHVISNGTCTNTLIIDITQVTTTTTTIPPVTYNVYFTLNQNSYNTSFEIKKNGISVVSIINHLNNSTYGDINSVAFTINDGDNIETYVSSSVDELFVGVEASLTVTQGLTALYDVTQQSYPGLTLSYGPFFPSGDIKIESITYDIN